MLMDPNRACSVSELVCDGDGTTSGRIMHHSHSTPAGVDGGARTPPTTPKKAGKMLAVRVQMLDDSVTMFQIQAKALGRVLFDQVCKQLHLLEADYFGLEYQDLAGTRYWLDLQKPVSRQLGLSLVDPLLRFCVKFYTPDPGQLEEEFTRYLFCLQVKRDLSQGHLQCNDNTAALMASYIVQAECGDYVAEDYPDHTYLSSYKFVPHQDHELECRIMDNHKKHAGQSPAEADLNLLETARRCELYGMKMHPAKDHEGVQLNLAVAHMGIVVFQHYAKINTFSWAKIRKISFKRKRFLIKLHPEGYGYYKDLVEFFFEGRNECKNFWKKCVEHHGFFRCSIVKHVPRHKTRVLSRGSSFRYSGKTQKQMVEFVRDNYVKRQTFQRSSSFRHSAHSSAVNVHSASVGNSISAHPLLPLADSVPAGEFDKVSLDLKAELAPAAGKAVSLTTRAVCHPPDIAIRSPHNIITPYSDPGQAASRTTSSPSPPPTTQSVSVEICTTTSQEASIAASSTTSQQRGAEDTGAAARLYGQRQGQTSSRTHIPTITTTTHTTTPQTSSNARASTGNLAVPRTVRTAADTTGYTSRTYTPKSEGSLDKSHCTTRDRFVPAYDSQSQTSLVSLREPYEYSQTLPKSNQSGTDYYSRFDYRPHPKPHMWQRSASCRELYDYSFQDTPRPKKPTNKPSNSIDTSYLDERKLESPITRYDDSHKNYYSTASSRNGSLDVHQDIIVVNHKVYSSSYPGTVTLSQESVEDPGNYELAESQDDLSHDSYELIERSDDECSTSGGYHFRESREKIRSGSLDSGNYIQSMSDSDSEDVHRYKSTSDVQDIFMMDDPRDFPREINPPKSDGSFYKNVKMSSRTSSLESKSDYYDSIGSSKKLSKGFSSGSRTSSPESKSDRESKKRENVSRTTVENVETKITPVESNMYTFLNYDKKLQFEQNFAAKSEITDKKRNSLAQDSFPTFKETTHVHSVSLQNVETERNIRTNRLLSDSGQNTVPRTQKAVSSKTPQSATVETQRPQVTHIWPESICGLPTEITNWPESKSAPSQPTQKSVKLESNIFSFDDDKIQELRDSDKTEGIITSDYPYPPLPILEPSIPAPFDTDYETRPVVTEFKEIDIMPTAFPDTDVKKTNATFITNYQTHAPIERTKSDPNSLARQRLGSNSRRHMLMHQKSIDLTPAESSDEDYIYRQIPSAPPLTKGHASRFEMPTAEFGHFDILQRDIEGQKIKFEVPKSQFEVLGAKTQFDLINLPPKDTFDIPYVLHKRHVMNGTASKAETPTKKSDSIVEFVEKQKPIRKPGPEQLLSPKSVVVEPGIVPESEGDEQPESEFLFTQNVDLSNINPITLEIDKNDLPVLISSPKRDITKIDPTVLETLNLKLSRIESDSPPIGDNSLTEKIKLPPVNDKKDAVKSKVEVKTVYKQKHTGDVKNNRNSKDNLKEGKPKRVIKTRPQAGKKGTAKQKGKTRITSFSSDDESLNSDDVFGSTEATPTKLEFSPPQPRKEMEGILKFESERQTHLQYTMSSTEIEGSPPQPRKTEYLPYDRSLEPTHTELRRISERSFSIPSSEDDVNVKPPGSKLPPEVALLAEPIMDDKIDDTQVFLDEIPPAPPEFDEKAEDVSKDDGIKTKEVEPESLVKMSATSVQKTIDSIKIKSLLESSPPIITRRAQSPALFAHARLNLSEGSGVTAFQRQTAVQSPTSSRRAKSLDTAVVSVTRLPPPDSFSSKDDTVDTNGAIEEVEEPVSQTKATPDGTVLPEKTEETDQIVPDVTKAKKPLKLKDLTPPDQTERLKTPTEEPLKKSPTKEGRPEIPKSLQRQKSQEQPKGAISKEKSEEKTESGKEKPKTSITKERSLEKQRQLSREKIKTQTSKEKHCVKKVPLKKGTKSQEHEPCKRPATKEKSKSFEKLELKRMSSKERSKSQDDNEMNSARRKEKQQMLYETAIKQTKTLKSPVKETLPPFPVVEDSVSVSDGKLEIKIDVASYEIPEDAIIITKSPKKLDKKLTKSLELNFPTDPFGSGDEKQVQRLGQSLDLDQRKYEGDSEPQPVYSTETADTSEETSDLESETLDDLENGPADNPAISSTTFPDSSSDVDNKAVSLAEDSSNQYRTDIIPTSRSDDESKFPESKYSSISPVSTKSLGTESHYKGETSESDHVSKNENIYEVKETLTVPVKMLDTQKTDVVTLELPKLKDLKSSFKVGSEEESLTEVSEVKLELIKKLSTERSRSEDTTSWVTVECDEIIGLEGELSVDEISPPPEDKNHLSTEIKSGKGRLLKFCDNRSRSSDTTGSWTSGEKDISPGNQNKEPKSDESSVSCSIMRPLGISQHIEKYDSKEELELETGQKISLDISPDESLKTISPEKAPRIAVLKRTTPIDDESSSGSNGRVKTSEAPVILKSEKPPIPKKPTAIASTETSFDVDKPPKSKYPFEQKWLSEAELRSNNIKLMRTGSDKSQSSLDESASEKAKSDRNSLDKPKIQSLDKLSVESKNSVDTESSSGSLGAAARLQRTGEAPLQEPSSTWRPFLMESSGSSSLEDAVLPPDYDVDDKEYFFTTENNIKLKSDDEDEVYNLEGTFTEVPTHFGYPCLTSTLSGVGMSTDILPTYGTSFLARTLSRISERSSNSEKSSLEENTSRHSTHYDSMNDESLVSSDQQASLSSDPPSKGKAFPKEKTIKEEKIKNIIQKQSSSSSRSATSSSTSGSGGSISSSKHSAGDKTIEPIVIGSNLQRQISDDRRTSAEMPDISLDDIELLVSESALKRQNSDDTIIEESSDPDEVQLKPSSSQESEDWPLPEIPTVVHKQLSETSEDSTRVSGITLSYDVKVPKVFGLCGREDSGQWPSPPSSGLFDIPVVGSVETYMVHPEEPCKVIVSDLTPEIAGAEDLKFVDDDEEDDDYDEVYREPSSAAAKQSSSGSDDSSLGLASGDIILDSKYSSDEDENGPPVNKCLLQVSGPHSEGASSKHSEDDNSSFENTTVKSAGLSLSECSSFNTVKFQNLSASYSGTSKSFKSGHKDDDSSLFDNPSISEWSSSNSHTPKGPNSPVIKTTQHKDLEKIDSQSPTETEDSVLKSPVKDAGLKTFTKSTERPVKIPHCVDSSSSLVQKSVLPSLPSKLISKSTSRQFKASRMLQKSMSIEHPTGKLTAPQSSKTNTNFKTVPQVRSHRVQKRKSQTGGMVTSSSITTINVDRSNGREYYRTSNKKYKPERSKSSLDDSIHLHTSILSQQEDETKSPTYGLGKNNCLEDKRLAGDHIIADMKPCIQEMIMNNVNNIHSNGTFTTDDLKRRRCPTDKAYFIAKEILMTERTYKKDLDVINVWWRNEVGNEETSECEFLLSMIDRLALTHGSFAHDLELCLQMWEGRLPSSYSANRQSLTIGEILLNTIPVLLPLYEDYLDGHTLVLEQLEAAFRRNQRFEQLYRDFELQKVCYQPFTSFILKPLHRLIHYQNLLDRLLEHYDVSHEDRAGCVGARAALKGLLRPVTDTLVHSENLAALCELQRDIMGFDLLTTPSRTFLRHGCLLKHSRKGYQQRMFFLFSDILLYTSRMANSPQFRVHGHMPLRGVMLEEPEKQVAKYAFIIYGGNRALTVAANSQEEKDFWVKDLQNAIQHARDHMDANLTYLSLKSCCSSDEIIEQQSPDGNGSSQPEQRSTATAQRSNTTVQVCWHRNTTISMQDLLTAVENQLSGYLLRKFKNSNGWQKLWVVFTSFCLYFYKSSADDFPLASLPLLGYTVGQPTPADDICKDFVFKLQYKNHIYFFRAESEYSFQRWMEVIGSATNHLNKPSQESEPEASARLPSL